MLRPAFLSRRAFGARGLALAAAYAAGVPARADDAPLQIAGMRVRFASVGEARQALGTDDVYIRTTSAFQRAAVMGVQGDVSVERFLSYQATTALAWEPAAQARWTAALRRIEARLASVRVPLPPELLLVQTTGGDSSDTPYTRANAIFLPKRFRGPADDELIAHELFHVVSRAMPELATRLYAELGFEPVGELQFPAEWLAARLSNPDAPYNRHAMRIELDGRAVYVMPLLVAGSTRLAPGQTFFDVLQVRLLAVEPGRAGAATQPVRRADGQLLWGLAERTPAFLRRLGGNTDYIFHPEETSADNFAYLVTGKTVPNPDLLRRFEQVLGARKS